MNQDPKMKRKRYTGEFKRQVLDYAAASDKTILEICEDFKISPGLYYPWAMERTA